jgi:hypothetical protein
LWDQPPMRRQEVTWRVMARPYASEMARLSETFEWATQTDIEVLRGAVRTAGLLPLRAIGSGGSLTAAHALATFHQCHTSHLAAVATPLEAMGEPLAPGVSTWLLSAGGANVDVLAATRSLVEREPSQLAVLCGREDSPLAEICRAHPFTDLLLFPPPAGKDGFLATNSLWGFATLLARAYSTEFDTPQTWDDTVAGVRNATQDVSTSSWEAATRTLWTRPTTLVLYSPVTRIGAIDLESKFTEAALGNLQLADYRNFAHGRHHWLAKRGDISAVLAFITDADRKLAERTLALIPPNIPQTQLFFPGNTTAAALLSLLAALRITGWAGTARGIDPGRPGVPDFGRKLYHLPLPRSAAPARQQLSTRDVASISRKAGVSSTRFATSGELDRWREALNSFRDRLCEARFAGIVFDYDGTVVDTRDRFGPPADKIVAELIRLLDAGVWIAIATGRGASVRRDLQKSLPRAVWDRILIGYYNGAETAGIADDGTPDGRDAPCDNLLGLAEALRAQPELAQVAIQTDRPYQITLEAAQVLPESRLWDLAHQVILITGATEVSVTRSSHSIDIVTRGVSKLNVVTRLRDEVGDAALLTLGDRGRWPGNDFELLREPFSLSVDEVSVDPATCWNLANPGQRGLAVTLDYLTSLEDHGGRLRFKEGSLQ